MKTAKTSRLDEFAPDSCQCGEDGRFWLTVGYTLNQDPQYDFPVIVEYDGSRYYKMSHNSDKMIVIYAAAAGRAYHERYCDQF